jgi:hypothetical protein
MCSAINSVLLTPFQRSTPPHSLQVEVKGKLRHQGCSTYSTYHLRSQGGIWNARSSASLYLTRAVDQVSYLEFWPRLTFVRELEKIYLKEQCTCKPEVRDHKALHWRICTMIEVMKLGERAMEEESWKQVLAAAFTSTALLLSIEPGNHHPSLKLHS